MKKKILIFSLFILLIGCSLIGGSFSIKAASSDQELIDTWCDTVGDTGAGVFYGVFSQSYELENDWKGVVTSQQCSLSGSNVSCSYKVKTNGMYKLTVDYNGITKYVLPDANGYISFNVVAPSGTEVLLSSYPIKISNTTVEGTKISKSCQVNGNNGNIIVEEGNDVDPKREYSIYNFNFSLPYTRKNNYYGSSICSPLTQYKNSSYSSYIQSAVPECFDSADIDITTTDADVLERVASAVDYVKELANLTSDTKTDNVSSLYCQFDKNLNSVSSSRSSNPIIKSYQKVSNVDDNNGTTWYKVSCIESMKIEYDTPKASYSSGGFKYTVKLTSTEKCSVYPARQPTKPTVCRPTFYFTDHNTKLGGPNEEFVQCISACDGGKYTSSCSNTCYSEVYEHKKSINQISFINTDKNTKQLFSNIENMIYIDDDNTTECYVGNSYEVPSQRSYSAGLTDYFHWRVCPSARTLAENKNAGTGKIYPDKYTRKAISEALGTNKSGLPYGCVYGWQSETCSGAMECSNNCSASSVETKGQAQKLYEQEQKKQKQAKDNLKAKYDCVEKDGSWTCEEKTTTKTATNNATITRVVTNKGNALADNNGNVNFAGSSGPTITYNTNDISSFINFPKAFISLENGKVKYSETNLDSSKYRFGGYLFYTDSSTTSKNSNDIRYYPYNASNYGIKDNIMQSSDLKSSSTYGPNNTKINWNIITKIRNFGSDKQWNIDVNCFYGADVSLCATNDPKCFETEKCENCVAGNLPYIYRTVNLDDLFPDNRKPRYNWTNNAANEKASTTGYTIDPETLISDIESKGNSIYNSTPYTTLSIGKNGYNWNDVKNDGSLYTNFDGNYSTLTNGVNFYNSKYVSNHQKTNMTK